MSSTETRVAQSAASASPASWGQARTQAVTWYDPAITVAGADGLTGLQFMRAIMDGRVPPPPIALLLNMRVHQLDHGLAVFGCTPSETAYNPLGVVHGGLMCTLADTAAGGAVHTTLAAGVSCSSVDITVNFLRPVTVDSGELVATGRVVKSGRRMALASVDVHDGSGRLAATASSNCLIIPAG